MRPSRTQSILTNVDMAVLPGMRTRVAGRKGPRYARARSPMCLRRCCDITSCPRWCLQKFIDLIFIGSIAVMSLSEAALPAATDV